MLSRAIEQAQTTVESRNFQARKSVLEYDDVMNKQREIIYGQRKQVLDGMDVKGIIMGMMESAIGHQVRSAFNGPGAPGHGPVQGASARRGGRVLHQVHRKDRREPAPHPYRGRFHRYVHQGRRRLLREEGAGDHPPVMRELERVVLLRVVDEYWMDHIDAMQDLRQGSVCGPTPRPTRWTPTRRSPWRCSRR